MPHESQVSDADTKMTKEEFDELMATQVEPTPEEMAQSDAAYARYLADQKPQPINPGAEEEKELLD